jgi:hypothetical protein
LTKKVEAAGGSEKLNDRQSSLCLSNALETELKQPQASELHGHLFTEKLQNTAWKMYEPAPGCTAPVPE